MSTLVPATTARWWPRPAAMLGLAIVIALAWLLLIGGAHVHAHPAGGALAPHWGREQWLASLGMWMLMPVAMMLPAAAPAIVSLAGAGPDANGGAGFSLCRTTVFAIGYLLVWWCFGAAATVQQWLLASAAAAAARHAPADAAIAGALTAGGLLALAGLYQFSALKRRCLAHCRGPLEYLRGQGCDPVRSPAILGVRHGLHCLGCCWALMLLMLLGGAMSIGWTAALAVLGWAEKRLPAGFLVGRVAGVALLAWGGVQLAAAWP